jgi:uridine kinase
MTYLLGVSGGSGSGKTYFARDLQARLTQDHCALIYQDSFYIDQSHKFDKDGGSVNFDHPSAIDFDLMCECLIKLKEGREVELPIYDFATHSRLQSTQHQAPRKLIIVDGILIFHHERLRSLFDHLIFFETDEQIRFERRLARDVVERGRTEAGVRDQFYKQVKPMHDQFVQPSSQYSNQVIVNEDDYHQVLERFVNKFIGD